MGDERQSAENQRIVGTHGSCVLSATNNRAQYLQCGFGRKSPRADFHDYSGGHYFITICTNAKIHYFGEIQNGEMLQTAIGKYCHREIQNLPEHYPYVRVPLFVVMPNHIHAIISIEKTEDGIPALRTALSVVIGGFKRAITLYARRNNIPFSWQTRYHDHIIRNAEDASRIAEYIENNIARWDADCFRTV